MYVCMYLCMYVCLYTCILYKSSLDFNGVVSCKAYATPREQRVDVAPLTQMCIGREKYGYWIGYAYTGD